MVGHCTAADKTAATTDVDSEAGRQRQSVDEALRLAGLNYPLIDIDGRPAFGLENIYKGRPAFLVCGGPSLNSMDLSPLQERGLLVAAVNNVAATHVRPHVWFSVDNPERFSEAIWRDPAILKIVKHRWRVFGVKKRATGSDPSVVWYDDPALLKRFPGIVWIQWVVGWNPETFLTQPLPTWGVTTTLNPDEDGCQQHSVMLVALRMLYWLGCRTVYLLGCDFSMDAEERYAFPTHPDQLAALDNAKSYRWLNARFHEVRPHFDQHGYRVVNCTPDSGLTAFERMPFSDAVDEAKLLLEWPDVISTVGLY